MKRARITVMGAGLAAVLGMAPAARAADLDLTRANLLAVADGEGTARIAAALLARDLTALGGHPGAIVEDAGNCATLCVVIGTTASPVVQRLAREGGVDLSPITGGWERYVRAGASVAGRRYLLIVGSDARGAAYGVTDLSRALGVSPWEWWADVTPRRRDRITIDDAPFVSLAPSVKYRGIFLNDEDWGLEPWAAKTFDPAKGNIGPKTYARVFELMWRLKANTLWPAMHSVSTPFFGDPGNAPLARRYGIVIGSSHAEPMLRNNLREWDEGQRGGFDFTRRPQAILDYWRERVGETKGQEAFYTVGLRGLHDGPMQGVTTTAARRSILEDVVGRQRGLLADTLGKPAAQVPQLYVAYHELQEAYDAGLTLPGDVTLMWTDDNYGYLRRLSTPEEQKRPGGAGVYYHLSYWGRPHDYLWLGTTHPALIREEMGRAWATDARRIWVVNVGDIKPIEYLSQYFLDLAFDARLLDQSPREHLRRFMAEQFGEAEAGSIADVMMRFYDLAWPRKPEFMGFGQTEWVTPNRPSGYVQSDGEEAQARIAAYQALVVQAAEIAKRLPEDRSDAFHELVLYPVRGAAWLNTRILSLDLAELNARDQRASPNFYVGHAQTAQAMVEGYTARYNALAGGKWRGMMDMAPRRLPVFSEPMWPSWQPSTQSGCATGHWGAWIGDENVLTFTRGVPAERPVTLYQHQPQATSWAISDMPAGLTLSQDKGELNERGGYEQRMTLRYDGKGAVGPVTLRCGEQPVVVHATALAPPKVEPGMAIEDERRVTMPALAARYGGDWEAIPDLGSQHGALRAKLTLPTRGSAAQGTPATWRFATMTEAGGTLRVVALPTHPRDPAHGLRAAVRLDDGEWQTVDFATIGRSDQWRQNVLTNTAVVSLPLKSFAAGDHRVAIVPLDPGLTLDRVELVLDGARPLYAPLPETAR
ncbi:glycosyl hydrolase 115 family protein [Sphingomonas sanguinis]|uniref:Glycosyl hydrolase 115 family protein n=1 Tax=Sphingomonas sanguinis TaxID=33051 RepID=A0ABU5LW82_9SPHN|nr:glycosyl hydrolase 115 family protein [Sphingomonas sanguinis]MDZ7284005.1 glycosyl hydrolase 115 family protein [Sphingomonas sanguinis]